MPPWKADGHPGEFVAQPRLTRDDVARIAPLGQGAGRRPGHARRRRRAGPTGWYLGQPDLVVTLPAGYTLPGEPSDVFRIFAVPLPGDRHPLRARHRVPSRQRAGSSTTPTSASTAATARDASTTPIRRPATTGCWPARPNTPTATSWAGRPGRSRRSSTPTWRGGSIPAPTWSCSSTCSRAASPKPVRPTIGFYFGDQPPTRTPSILRLGSQGIDIPPGDGPLRGRGSLHPAGGRDAAGGAAARALPRRRRHRHGDLPRRHRPARSSTSAAGTSAGSTSTATPSRCGCRAAPTVAMRYVYDNSAAESAQSADAAGAGALGPALVRRDGRPVVPARHRQRRRSQPCCAARCRPR